MSHREREHAPGTVERGNDWLDGALAGWLLFIAISAGQLAWFSIRDGRGLPALALDVAAPVLALSAIFPLLRFLRVGWVLAFLTLGLMAVREGMMLAGGRGGWQSTAAFLAVNVIGLAYLLWIIPEFWPPRHAEAAPAASAEPPPAVDVHEPAPREESAAPASAPPSLEPTPVERALAAIHHRIVAAGSACAVTSGSVRAEAGRFGVTMGMLRTEGLALYGTFLRHFMADGALSPDEERELICLERALDLDDDGVWRLRAEAGLVSGAAPPLLTHTEPALQPAAADTDRLDAEPARIGASPADRPHAGDAIDGTPPRDREAAEPDLSAQADLTSSVPRSQSPGLDAGRSAAEPEPSPEPAPAPEPGPIPEPASARPPEPAAFPIDPAPAPAAPDVLADYEAHELGALLAWAGIARLPDGAPPRGALDRLRALHRTGTEPLEACASDHPLEPGEQCLSIRTVELYRVPPAAPRVAPAPDVPGPVLDPRALVDGSLDQERDLSAYQRTGVCRFLLTERRLLLVAPSGQQSPLPLSRVRAVHPFRNGLEVRPQTGHAVFLAFTGGVDDVAMRVDRAVRDLRA